MFQFFSNSGDNLIPTNETTENVDGKIPLKFAFDSGWQKRGTGHAYNSLSGIVNMITIVYEILLIIFFLVDNSTKHNKFFLFCEGFRSFYLGHAMLVGYHSGKIASYAVRSKNCRMCQLGHSKNDHDCRKNYAGSAKSMEPDMAIELFTKNKLFDETNVYASVIIGDDDSSTIAGVRRNATHEIEKWSDFNHALKSLTSALYAMKLPQKLIEYFSRCFSNAVKQNKGEPSKVKMALETVVPHAFGNHSNCGEWCKYHELKENYRHNNLPHGKPLTDARLRENLEKLFSRFANNAPKLAPCASTQANESINNIVASKNPKARHYSASESLCYRVAAAVCQKNIGSTYVTNVYNNLQLSPGRHTVAYRQQKDKKREIKAKLSKTIEIKKRRLYAKKMRSLNAVANQRQEGVTYESGVSLNNISEITLNVQSNKEARELKDVTKYEVVYFDIETTGLKSTDEICQVNRKKTIFVYNTRGLVDCFNLYNCHTRFARATNFAIVKSISSTVYHL